MDLSWLILPAALLAEVATTHLLFRRALRRPAHRLTHRERWPSITVIRPIRGLDTGFEENIRAALDHGYPGEAEILFVFDDDTEPELLAVRRAIRAHDAAYRLGKRTHPANARVLFCGPPPVGRTGKLHAMIVALREAHGDLVAFADSDTRAAKSTLATVVDTLLERPDAGCAFAPVVVTQPPLTLGDAGYALMLNGLYSPAAAAAARRRNGTLPFIMGQLMVLRPQAIRAIGGLEDATGQLVDDMYLGRRLAHAGWNNVVAPTTLPIIQQGIDFGEFTRVYVRWLAFSRTGLPAIAVKARLWLHAGTAWLGIVLFLLAALAGQWAAALLAALVPIALAASVDRLHQHAGGAPLPARYAWVPIALVLGGPFAMLRLLFGRGLDWRGRVYTLDARSRLGT